jgi:hypothetical protein
MTVGNIKPGHLYKVCSNGVIGFYVSGTEKGYNLKVDTAVVCIMAEEGNLKLLADGKYIYRPDYPQDYWSRWLKEIKTEEFENE